jgi:hypothetical protein
MEKHVRNLFNFIIMIFCFISNHFVAKITIFL